MEGMAEAGSGPGTQQPWGFRLEMVGTHRNGSQRGVGLARMVEPEGTEAVSGECHYDQLALCRRKRTTRENKPGGRHVG